MSRWKHVPALLRKVAAILKKEGPLELGRKVLRKSLKTVNRTSPLRRRHQQTLRAILAQGVGQGVVVFFPTVDWNWMKQRPHQLITQFAKKGYLCFFVTDQLQADRVDGFKAVMPNLYLCSDLTLLHELPRPILWMSEPDQAERARDFRQATLIYDVLDTLEVTTVGPVTDERLARHHDLLQAADLVTVTARRLMEETLPLRPDALLVPNGVDPAHFAPDATRPVPADLAPIKAKGRPIVGYFGALADWFDYDLLDKSAEALPQCEFVLLGPDYDGSIRRLPSRPNVHYLGLKPYAELPGYLQYFDVATIPFVVNTITRATSPVKLFEYMAGGKAIVTTAMDEAMQYQGVLVGDSHAQFIARLEEALHLKDDPAYQGVVASECQENTWSQRVDRMLEALADRPVVSRDAWVILSGVPIDDSGGGQRPAQLALELLSRGLPVTYVSKYPKNERQNLGLSISHPLLDTRNLSEFEPALHLPAAGQPTFALVELPHPDFMPLLREIKARGGRIVYDLIDDWRTSLGGDWYDAAIEAELITMSDRLVASAQDLQVYLQDLSGREVGLIQNAVNLSLFNREREYAVPVDMPQGAPVILYVGALWGEWFDWELLRAIAEANPQAHVVLIGDYHGQCPFTPLPNMRFLGLKAQRDLPAYLAHAAVTIIPFKDSVLTQAVSPLKVFEYLAMGRPVVSVALRELEGLPHVHLAKSHADFVSALADAFADQVDDQAIQEFVRKNSWAYRIDSLVALLEESPREARASEA